MEQRPEPRDEPHDAEASPASSGLVGALRATARSIWRDAGDPRRPAWLDYAAVLALAFVVRVAHAGFIARTPFFLGPIIDAQTYRQLAVSLVAGNELPAFYQPPLYPLFLALLEWVGIGPGWGLALVQAALGSITCALLVGLCRALLGTEDKRSSRRAALLTGLSAALYGPLVAFDIEMLPPSLVHVLIALGLLLAARARRGVGWDFGAGLAFGLATIGWVPSFLFALAAPFLSGRSRRAAALGAVAVLAGLAMPVAATAVHNANAGAPGVLVSYNGGLNLWLGNNPRWRDTWRARPGADFHPRAAEAQRRGAVTPSQQDQWFRGQAIGLMMVEVDATLLRTGEKLYYAWHGRELRRNQDLELLRDASPVLAALMWAVGIGFPFGLVAPLALLGAWRRREDRRVRALMVAVFVYSLSLAVIFVSCRYRLPMALALLPLAMVGLSDLVEGRLRRLELGALVALTAILSLPLPFMESFEADPRERAILTAHALRNQGDRESAAQISARLIERYPEDANVQMLHAESLSMAGRCPEAVPHLERVVELVPRAVTPLMGIANCYRRHGRTADAEQTYARALAIDPYHPQALRAAAVLYSSTGRPRHALQLFRRLRENGQSDDDVDYDLGRLLVQLGEVEEARGVLGPLARRHPDDQEIAALLRQALATE